MNNSDTFLTSDMSRKRVCVIGAGPTGCSALVQFKILERQGFELPEIVCYEKQKDLGGMWNFTWRTGTDEYGELIPNGMYRQLWSNGPKEIIELGDYTYDEHFRKRTPSFLPRVVMYDYLQGRWNKHEIRPMVKSEHVVHWVEYRDDTRRFRVIVRDLAADKTLTEEFDYVVVASGHFSTPNIPEFPGIDKFPGRVMHSHDFRDANEFKGQRVLLIGAGYSAEDIAMQLFKFGAKHVTISHRTKPMNYDWPDSIDERPLLTFVEGQTAHFKDESRAAFDSMIYCTGYKLDNRFMEERLRLRGVNPIFHDDCYKNVVWMPAANGQLFYLAQQDIVYGFTMHDVQAHFAAKIILGQIKLPPLKEMEKDFDSWLKRSHSLKNTEERIYFQTDYVLDIKKLSGYPYETDCSSLLLKWKNDREYSIFGYRDVPFTSLITGTTATEHHTPWAKNMDDTSEDFFRN